MTGSGTHGHGPINQLKQMVCRGVREEFIEKWKQRSLVAYPYPWFASGSTCYKLGETASYQKSKTLKLKVTLNRIVSVRFGQGLGFGLLIRWLQRTGIGKPFALRSPASAPLVGGNGGAGRSAPVGFLGDGKLSHTYIFGIIVWQTYKFTINSEMICFSYL